MIEYYDLVLAFIPVALVGVPLGLGVVGVDAMAAIPVGAVAAGLATGHALFVNGPRDADGPPDASSSQSTRPINAD